MKDRRLVDLNFREILNYGGQPPVQYRYSSPLACQGYCVDCEEAGIVKQVGGRLDMMSHGCDSADFEAILGKMPREGTGVDEPILFLLENPGGHDENGKAVRFGRHRKEPPVKHYYWTPNSNDWPVSPATCDETRNYYGTYFAYLMRRHQLQNVYITNLIKCKWVQRARDPRGSGDDSAIVRHCVERFLKRELQFVGPRAVFCFGQDAQRGFVEHVPNAETRYVVVTLMHPAYIQHRYGTSGRSQKQLFEDNDQRIANGLVRLKS